MGLRDIVPTKDQLFAVGLSIWRKYRPEDDTSPLSYIWTHLKKEVQYWQGVHQTGLRMMYALHPQWSHGFWLEGWMNFFGRSDGDGGYGKIKLKAAYGGQIAVVGTTGSVLAGTELLKLGSYTFQVTESATWTADGTKYIGVKATTQGAGGNLEAGQVMTFITAPPGITSDAEVVGALDHGANEEQDSEARSRLRTWAQNGPLSGNCADIRERVENLDPANYRCYVYPKRNGAPYGWGTVDVAVMQKGESGTARFMDSSTRDQILAQLQTLLPGQIWKDIRVLATDEEDAGGTSYELTFEVTPTASETSKADWDAESLKRTVGGYTEGSLQIVASGDITYPTVELGLKAGSKVHIDGYDLDVTGVVSATAFTIDSWPWGSGSGPSSGPYIQAGGGLIDAVRAAEKDYLDSLGPERGDNADPTDRDWRDAVLVDWMRKYAVDVSQDMLGVTVDDIGGGGSNNYSPTPSTTTTVNVITPGKSVVWQKWPS